VTLIRNQVLFTLVIAAAIAVAATGFAALVVWRAPPLAVVLLTPAAGVALGLAGG